MFRRYTAGMKPNRLPNRPSLAGLALAALLSLSACGGGGGDSTPAAAPPVAVTPPTTPPTTLPTTPPTQPAPLVRPQAVVIAGAYEPFAAGDYVDGAGNTARFSTIDGLATDNAGNIYVNDTGNCVIRKITPAGQVSTLAGAGKQCAHVDGSGDQARLTNLAGMAIDLLDNLYVGNGWSIRRITPAGVVSTLAGTPDPSFASSDGLGAQARFQPILGLAMAPDGHLLVSTGSYNVTSFDCISISIRNALRSVTLGGAVSTVPGSTAGCPLDGAMPLSYAADLKFDSAGRLYLLSRTALVKQDPGGSAAFMLDSTGNAIRFAGSKGGNTGMRLAAGDDGNVYVLDNDVVKVAPDGTRTVVLSGSSNGPAETTPDLNYDRITALTYIGKHEFLVALNNRVVRITLK